MPARVRVLVRRPKSLSVADALQPNATPRTSVERGPAQFSADRFLPQRAVKTAAAASQLADRLAALPGDLRLEWRRLYRAEPPRLSRDIIMRAIAYRLQETALGGLSRTTLRRLTTLGVEIETDGEIAPPPSPRIKPGARLIREWHGRTHTICVTKTGFEFDGKTYRSLTKIAFDITGAQWSGPRFFGLAKTSAAPSASASNGAGTAPESSDD